MVEKRMNISPIYSDEEVVRLAKADGKLWDDYMEFGGNCMAESFDNLEARLTKKPLNFAIKVQSDAYVNSFGGKYAGVYTYHEQWANVVGEDGLNRLEKIHQICGPRYYELFKQNVLDIDPQAKIECVGTVDPHIGVYGYTRKSWPDHEHYKYVLTSEEAHHKFEEFLLMSPNQEKEAIELAKENFRILLADFGKAVNALNNRRQP